jgi:hypothetical protein
MSDDAERHASALVALVRRLEAENAALRQRVAELESSHLKPQLNVTATIKKEEGGVIRARGREIAEKAKEVEKPNVREVVRGKRDREAMQGYQCDQCKELYDALGVLPHKCSKHKMHRPPPDTPDGFWEPWSFD